MTNNIIILHDSQSTSQLPALLCNPRIIYCFSCCFLMRLWDHCKIIRNPICLLLCFSGRSATKFCISCLILQRCCRNKLLSVFADGRKDPSFIFWHGSSRQMQRFWQYTPACGIAAVGNGYCRCHASKIIIFRALIRCSSASKTISWTQEATISPYFPSCF